MKQPETHALSESSGFGGTICNGISSSVRHTMSAHHGDIKFTDHLPTSLLSCIRVFRGCQGFVNHVLSCVCSKMSSPEITTTIISEPPYDRSQVIPDGHCIDL